MRHTLGTALTEQHHICVLVHILCMIADLWRPVIVITA
jgi:hypothetical protein